VWCYSYSYFYYYVFKKWMRVCNLGSYYDIILFIDLYSCSCSNSNKANYMCRLQTYNVITCRYLQYTYPFYYNNKLSKINCINGVAQHRVFSVFTFNPLHTWLCGKTGHRPTSHRYLHRLGSNDGHWHTTNCV